MEAGVRTLVDILKKQEPDTETAPSIQSHIPHPADLHDMASGIAASVSGAAQDTAASEAGWDKIWHSQHDLKVRYSHAFLDRNRVPAEESFVTQDGVLIRYPHDPAAPADETINCRCYMKYVRADTRKKR